MNANFNVEWREIDDLMPYENNPRINDNAVDAVAASIKEFGFRNPVVVDSDGIIICGHTRWKAAKKLGLEKLPVHVARDLTADQVRALRIADNKTSELSSWDYDILPIELAALSDAGFDLEMLCFDESELAKLLDNDVEEGLTDPDEIPDEPEEAICKPGDIWQLGDHRLLCGDATIISDVEKLVNGKSIDLFLTDAPYGVDYVGKTADKLTIENDSMEEAEFREFLSASFSNANCVLREGGAFYIWHSDSRGFDFRSSCESIGWSIRQCLVWVKNSMVLGRQDYQWQHEPCLYGWKDGASHHWYSDRKQTTVLNFDRPTRSAEHPTMKPVALIEYQMCNSSKRGDIVLDVFAGSGTTLIAAQRTGRIAYVMELMPKYCDVIIKRWEDFTGEKAQRFCCEEASS